jgi:glutamyl-tRNA synthetase
MSVTVRFAPSPTGLLHVGNARVALVNWLFARREALDGRAGKFVLRIDDTDRARSLAGYDAAIREDLQWLGLHWDNLVRQSDRTAEYEQAMEKLKAAGRLYPAYESAEELEAKRRRQLARKLPPVYDRSALKLTEEDRRQLEAEGRKPHWRFLLNEGTVAWRDLVHGEAAYETRHLSDPVLVREDGTLLYTLPSVVDDIDLAISHVIRGEDHLTNTAVQIQLFEALGATPPAFAHLPLMTDISGAGLSKRLGSLSLRDLREQGIEPMALNSLLAAMGTSDAVAPHDSLDDLARNFSWEKFGRAPPKFDAKELDNLNAKMLHGMSFAAAQPRLAALGLADVDEAFWLALRPNLAHLGEIADWWQVCRAPLAPVIQEPDFLAQAAAALPDGALDAESWPTWTKRLAETSGRKGKALYQPLRLALTGREHGPEMKNLLPLIGAARAKARLSGKTA